MRRLSDEFKKPEDFITQEDKESAPKPYSSEYTLESMKKHHDAVHGRISNAFRNGYDNIKWD
jgi:hypothetical protein